VKCEGSDSVLDLEALLPLTAAWVKQEEARILREGVALTESQRADARAVGVFQPERVRVLVVPRIPMPQHPALVVAGTQAGLLGGETLGLSLRYGIYLKVGYESGHGLLAHELVHTAQYERLGSPQAFLRQYLGECLAFGYPAAPLEQEAIRLSALAVCGTLDP
jgi:hypothetical protein